MVGLMGCLPMLVLDCSAQVGKKFLEHAEPHVAPHRDAEAHSPIGGRTLTGGLPRSGQEGAGRHSTQLRNRDMATSIIRSREDSARNSVSYAGPEPPLSRIKVTGIFMQHAAKAECHCALD